MAATVTVFRDQVADALRAVRVTSSTSYTWFGRPGPSLKRVVRTTIAADAARQYLVARLEQELYRSFYLPGLSRPRVSYLRGHGADPAFVATLSDANAGSGGWGRYWKVVELREDGAIVAERNGLRVWMDASDYRPAGGGSLAPGASVCSWLPKEQRTASPGFYVAHGDAGGEAAPHAVEVRVYFNITSAGATALLAAATRLLNEQRLAFSIKLLNRPARYFRCDAAVLYLDRSGFATASGSLQGLLAVAAPHLRAETPPLTKALARGVGIGEHWTRLGPSFGIGRCRLVAKGIVDAHDQRLTALTDRVDAVARQFALHDMDIDVPYLVSGGRDRYVL